MREIKFRAWTNDGMWTVNGLACSDDPEYSEHFDLVDCTIGGHEKVSDYDIIDDCELMQYTGIKDKNDFDIYECDIVKTEYGIGVVIFEYGEFVIHIKEDDEYYRFSDFLTSEGELLVEVLGNIYENPELLEE